MADQSDARNLITSKVAAVIYPNGTSQPSIAGVDVKIYPGWPVPNVLEKDLRAGGLHISVYPLPTERKVGTQIGRPYQVVTPGTPTISGAVSETIVTLSGSINTPQNVYLLVNKVGHQYAIQSGDTLTTIATALAMMISGATSTGPVITIAGASEITFRAGGVGTAVRELKRQEKDFQVTVWSPNPTLRDVIGSALDSALAETSNVSFADGSPGIFLYSRSFDSDSTEKYLLYRRDIIYSINFATTQTSTAPVVIAPVMNTNGLNQQI